MKTAFAIDRLSKREIEVRGIFETVIIQVSTTEILHS